MTDLAKTKAQLVDELLELRQRVSQLEAERAGRREIKETLGESEARYRAVVESQTELICRYFPDGTITFANTAYCRYFGKTPEELVGQHLSQKVLDEDSEPVARHFASFSPENPILSHEHRVIRPDGEIRWQRWTDRGIFDEAGNLVEIQGVGQDITDQKKAETERDRLFKLSIDMLCVAGFDGFFKHVNPSWTKTLGWTEEELLSKPWVEFVHPEDREATESARGDLREGRIVYSFENRYVCKDGTYRWLAWSSFPVPDEQLIHAVARDVTELKKMEESLFDAQRELSIKVRLSEVFLTATTDDELYKRVLLVVQDALDSPLGIFGYVDEDGSMVCPSLTRTVWEDCQVADKDVVFPRDTWGGIWGKAFIEKTTLYSNEEFRVPEGHVAITSHIVKPIVYGEELIGTLQLSNKEGGYNEKDKDLLDSIGDRLAPILSARLLREREEKRRKMAEKKLRELNEALEEQVEIRSQALKESEHWMRSIFNSLEEAVLVVTPDRTIREVNRAAEGMFGYTNEEVVGRSTEFYHVDHEHNMVFGQRTSEAFNAGKIANFEFEAKRKDGEIFPTSHSVSLLRDEEGTPFGIVSIVRDLTEQKRAEEALRESEHLLSTILSTSPVGISVARERRIEWANEAWKEMFGFEHETEYLGLDTRMLYPSDEEYDRLRELLPREIGTGKVAETDAQLRRKDGSVFDAQVKVRSLDPLDSARRVISTVADITPRKRMERAIRESEERFRNVFEQGPLGMAIVGLDYQWGSVNAALCEMVGYTEGDLRKLSFVDITHPEDIEADVEQADKLARGEIPSYKMEKRYIRKDGAVIWVTLTATLVRDPDGTALYYLSMIEDITGRKLAEQGIAEAYQFNETVLTVSPVGVTTYRADGQCVSVNEAMACIVGATREHLLNQNFREIESWQQSGLLGDAEEVLSTGVAKQREVHMVTTFGKETWLNCQFARFTYGGEPHLLLSVGDLSEVKQAEARLSASEKKYRELAELLPQLVYELDDRGFVTFLNDSGSQMTGYTHEDLCRGLNIRDVFHPEDLDRVLQDFSSALQGEPPQGREYTIIRKDGGIIPMIVYSSPVREDHRIVGLRGVAVDISERKEAEEAIRQQGEFLRNVLESLTHPFYVMNCDDYTITMANPVARSISSSGKTTCYALSHGRSEPCNTSEHPCPLEEVKRTKAPVRVEHVHYDKDGTARYVEVHAYPLFDSQGSVSQMIEYTLDITDRKKAQADLTKSEQRFRNLIESAPMCITMITQGRRQYVNPECVRMFGYERADEIVRLPVEDLYESKSARLIKDLIATELDGLPTPYRLKAKGLKKSGEPFEVMMWMVKTRFAAEPAILTFVLDVTEETSLRSQLLRAQKMESLGAMAGGIAHDFNNLLTIIQGYSELLLTSKTQTDPDYEDLQKIMSTAGKGADLVRRILTFSRKVESNRRPIDLNHEIQQSKKLLERTIPKMIALDLHLADHLKRVHADPAQIEQVLLNLAVNAQHAMPDGGTLTLETENVTLDEEYCRTHMEAEPGEYVVLSVSDTGHGMEKGVVEHIFEPFYTTKAAGEGTGLGLAMVYGIITGHGGRISCYSEPGHGTTFKMYLPAIEKETESVGAAREEVIKGGAETILLVDDEEFVRELGKRILSQSGYRVLTAENGQEALEVYRSQKDDISLVILDLVMPQMGGKECLAELLKIDPEARVLVASGFSANGPTKDAVEVGAKGFIGKPYKVTQLLQMVRKVLDEG